ncbi:MAG: membrane protein insertion efficiency factor YidD [Enterobacterales bacterium]
MEILFLILKQMIIYIINIYQIVISPCLVNVCRFKPTCSQYCIESISKFGILNGMFLTLKRILKCHPLNIGGNDNVPKC